jgi:hypothetical protein
MSLPKAKLKLLSEGAKTFPWIERPWVCIMDWVHGHILYLGRSDQQAALALKPNLTVLARGRTELDATEEAVKRAKAAAENRRQRAEIGMID